MTRPVERGVAAGRTRGQSLVEFALVFPIFFILFLGIIEFAFAFNAILAVNFASRNAALYAAEAGTTTGADCVILNSIEDDIAAPGRHAPTSPRSRSTAPSPTATTTSRPRRRSSRGPGRLTCTFPDGSTSTVPYTRTSNGYPELNRCNILAGCGGTHTTIDHIGVRIYYTHTT